jgi:hypothetical protein
VKRRKVRRRVAGAPGFEPGNGGIKIRCLTTWLRPIGREDHILARLLHRNETFPGGLTAGFQAGKQPAFQGTECSAVW